jgi:NitT/TauT family transport system substrate-binding protein
MLTWRKPALHKRALLGIWLGGAITVLGLVLWWVKPASHTDTFTTTAPIRIAMAITPLSAPFMVAHTKGYFAEHGLLNVTLIPYVGGHRALRAIFAGEADIATASDLPTMFHSFTRDDYAVLFTFVTSDHDVKVITRHDTGIRTAADLAGKTIGATLGASSHFFLKSFLVYHQVNTDNINLINVSPEDMTKALQNGEVDAVSTWEPFAYETVQALGRNALTISRPEAFYQETFNAIAQKPYIHNNKEIIYRIARSIDKAINFIRNNEEPSQAIVRQFFPGDTALLSAIWQDFVFDLSLDQSLLVTLENEARWAINNGLVEAKTHPNYLHYLYLDAVKAVRPEAVSVIH